MAKKLSKAQLARIDSFKWRLWNTVKAPLVVVFTGLIIKILADISEASTIKVLFSWGYWDGVLVAMAQIIGGIIGIGASAGIDKIQRMK